MVLKLHSSRLPRLPRRRVVVTPLTGLRAGTGPQLPYPDYSATAVTASGGLNGLRTNLGPIEPAVAAAGDVVVYTGNLFAAYSTDGGRSFTEINRGTQTALPPGAVPLVDQDVVYLPKAGLFVWIMQYETTTTHFHMMSAAPAELIRQGAAAFTEAGHVWDIAPADFGDDRDGASLDFPRLTVGANSLYITGLSVVGGEPFHGVWKRVRQDQIAAGQPLDGPAIQTISGGVLPVVAAVNPAGTTDYFASFVGPGGATPPKLLVAKVDESQTALYESRELTAPLSTTGDYTTPTPGAGRGELEASRWLGDARFPFVESAALRGNELWLAWTSAREPPAFPEPYITFTVIDPVHLTLTRQVNFVVDQTAVAYPALTTSRDGDLGLAYSTTAPATGDYPGIYPTGGVGIFDGDYPRLVQIGTGSGSGYDGDYNSIRTDGLNGSCFVAATFTVVGPPSRPTPVPYYTRFGVHGGRCPINPS
jgi:hypothetical protein